MSRDYTPRYRVEALDQAGWSHSSWSVRDDGRPTITSLEAWRRRMNQSFALDGVNGHMSRARGILVHISRARLIDQRSGNVVAEVSAPAFEVV